MLYQGTYSLYVFAMAVGQKTQAFTRTFCRPSYPEMIKLAQAEPVHGEASAANGARNFLEGIKRLLGAAGQTKDPDAGIIGRANQADRPLVGAFSGHKARIAKSGGALEDVRE